MYCKDHVAKCHRGNIRLQQYQIGREKTAVMCLKDNIKVFFSYLSEKRRVRNHISYLKSDAGITSCDPNEMADMLGAFFESNFVEKPDGEISSLEYRVPCEITDLRPQGGGGSGVLKIEKIMLGLKVALTSVI